MSRFLKAMRQRRLVAASLRLRRMQGTYWAPHMPNTQLPTNL